MGLKATYLSEDVWLKEKGKLAGLVAASNSWPTVQVSNMVENVPVAKPQEVVESVVSQLASLIPADFVDRKDLSVQVYSPKRSFYLLATEDIDELKQLLAEHPETVSLIVRLDPSVSVDRALHQLSEPPDSPVIKKLMFNMRFQLQVPFLLKQTNTTKTKTKKVSDR